EAAVELLEHLARRQLARQDLLRERDQLEQDLLQHRAQKLLLRLIPVIDHRLVHARALGDLVRAHAREALLREQLLGDGEDLLLGVARQLRRRPPRAPPRWPRTLPHQWWKRRLKMGMSFLNVMTRMSPSSMRTPTMWMVCSMRSLTRLRDTASQPR